MIDEPDVHVESGRLVVVPKRRRPKGPMADCCAIVSVPPGKLYVTPYYVQVAGHPGTAGLRRLTVTTEKPQAGAPSHEVFAHAPYLVIGDHSFVYPRSPGVMSEPGRALRACEANRRSGTYRADSSDVGVCLRTGWKRCQINLRQSEGGFACEVEPEQDASAA